MSNLLLSKPELPAGFIDVSVGEPHVVREKLFEVFDCSVYEIPKIDHMYEYPSPVGYCPLVKLLEDKHGHPVIITNGAKQALGAVFYALSQMSKEYIAMKSPYWALIPPMVKMHGLEPTYCTDIPDPESGDPFLLLAPNNPDGQCGSSVELKELSDKYKDAGVPFIHDAAYYTHSYLPNGYKLEQLGDVQIHSISKSLGLSGLRLGYVVCPNTEFYKHILHYMEAMTVGVSIVSQIFLHDLLHRMHGYPTLVQAFEGRASVALEESKKLIKQVSSEILEVDSNIENIPGMFGWFKVGPKADFQKAKINFIDGALFGVPGYVRMNLAFNKETMEEIVKRLNGVLDLNVD